jgi:predicted AAA+ superfamily ATPase
MPHQRLRHGSDNLLKKLSLFKVVGIQGARQTGKSFLVRQLLKPDRPDLVYQTFDQQTVLEFAQRNPESFLNQHEDALPLVIDEAQKVPKIFDAVKFVVDQTGRPGQFLLLGSTEFSKRTLIRESLTGRISIMRLYPMMCSETLQQPLSHDFPICDSPAVERGAWMRYLSRGGMPGFCFIRDDREREEHVKAWLDTTVNRDLALIPKLKLNPDLAMSILTAIARLEEPTAGNIARWLKRDPRVVNTHLGALSLLFAINKLEPHRSSTGKPMFFLCDAAFAAYLGAGFERQLATAVLQQLLAKNEYLFNGGAKLFFYRTTKGSFVNFLIEEKSLKITAIKLLFEEKIDLRQLEVLKALSKKITDQPLRLAALSPVKDKIEIESVSIYPWEAVC